jgi:hypothetical protein
MTWKTGFRNRPAVAFILPEAELDCTRSALCGHQAGGWLAANFKPCHTGASRAIIRNN